MENAGSSITVKRKRRTVEWDGVVTDSWTPSFFPSRWEKLCSQADIMEHKLSREQARNP